MRYREKKELWNAEREIRSKRGRESDREKKEIWYAERERYEVREEKRERGRQAERGEKREDKKRQIGKNVEIMVFCLAFELRYSVLGICRQCAKRRHKMRT